MEVFVSPHSQPECQVLVEIGEFAVTRKLNSLLYLDLRLLENTGRNTTQSSEVTVGLLHSDAEDWSTEMEMPLYRWCSLPCVLSSLLVDRGQLCRKTEKQHVSGRIISKAIMACHDVGSREGHVQNTTIKITGSVSDGS